MIRVGLLADAGELRVAMEPEAVTALESMVAGVAAAPSTIGRVFPAAARRTARGPLGEGALRVEDAVRVELVAAAASGLDRAALLGELEEIYRYGDADEKRAVLLALARVEDPDLDASALLLDALRTNDVRLVAAALGPHARHLSDHDWRHGVLKCLFVGVPLAEVADLAGRADAELGAMVGRYVDERVAAGRPVPDDATALIRLTTADASAPTSEG